MSRLVLAGRRSWGIAVLCVWTGDLIVEAVLRTWLFSLRGLADGRWIVEFNWAVWTPLCLYVAVLIATLVGLLKRWGWARLTLLGAVTAYYGLLLGGSLPIWGAPAGSLATQSTRMSLVGSMGVIGLVFGWWYLNRPLVKSWFGGAAGSQNDTAGIEQEDEHGRR